MKNLRLLLALIGICTFCGCNFFVSTGGFGVSNSKAESIQKSVFLQNYKPITNPVKINDTLSLIIESAWTERKWRYAGYQAEKAEIEDGNSCQIKIITSNLNGFNETWQMDRLKLSDGYFYEGYLNSIVGDFISIPKDTLTLKIHSGENPKEISTANFLGEIKLIRQ
ncbi:hypothetical protein ACFPVY_07275 [Flavobacterium qiangtangense]|uniref:Lipoprotein n=1 Tax=Flavobacterium qiangtangense TaxID=1442595 RepID=A0ABW1PLD8_9FLAO